MQSLGLGTPGQNQGQQAGNITNAINQGFANNQQAVNSSLAYLAGFLGQNPSPVSQFGNVTPPPQFGNGQTIGGGGTNSLGALVQPPATASAPLPDPLDPRRTAQQSGLVQPPNTVPLLGGFALQQPNAAAVTSPFYAPNKQWYQSRNDFVEGGIPIAAPTS